MLIKSETLKEHLYNSTYKLPGIFVALIFLAYGLVMSFVLGTISYIFISFSFSLIGIHSDVFHNFLHIALISVAFFYITRNMWKAIFSTLNTNFYYKNKKY